MADEVAAKRMMEQYGGNGNGAGVATRTTTTTYQPVTRMPIADNDMPEDPDDPTAIIYAYISAIRTAQSAARSLEAGDPTGMYIHGRDVTNFITTATVLIQAAERMLDA